MKRIMKKAMIIFIIIMMLFEFSYSSNISYAKEPPTSEEVNELTSLMGGIVSFVLWIPRIMAVGLATDFVEIMTTGLAEQSGISDAPIFVGTDGDMATPFDVFFNKYNLLSVDFFNIVDDGKVINNIRIGVAEWYYAMRSIASIILLCILIYVGIRMAISTVADEKAKYKKMLVDWICSLALIFLLQYIIIFTISANEIIVNFLRDIEYTDIKSSIEKIAKMATDGTTIVSLVATFIYCMISFQTISFIITYIQRVLKIGFLIIISPLISLTYSIDKIDDGKAQALGTWLKEFVYTILIQPFHCIMYLAFVNVAISLLNIPAPSALETIFDLFSTGNDSFNQLANGFLAILCLKFINDGETAIRKIFNFQDDSSLTSMAAGAALGLAALTNAKKIGGTAAKSLNKIKGVKRFTSAVKNTVGKLDVINRLKNSEHFSGLGNALEKLRDSGREVVDKAKEKTAKLEPIINKAKEIAQKGQEKLDKLKETKLIKGARGFYNKHGEKFKKVGSFTKKTAKFVGRVNRKALPIALGMMGAAMSYATGTSGAMQAIGVGSGLNSAAEEYFENSSGTLGSYKSDVNDKFVDAKIKRQDYDSRVKLEKALSNKGMSLSKKQIQEKCEAIWQQSKIIEASDYQLGENIIDEATGEYREATQIDIDAQKTKKEKAKEEVAKLLGADDFDDCEELYQAFYERSKSLTAEGRAAFREEELNAQKIASMSLIKHGKSDIAKQKNEIVSKIAQYKAKNAAHKKQVDNNKKNYISNEDMDSAQAAMKSITMAIDRNVLGSGGTHDISELIKKSMGIEDESSEAYQAIVAAVYEYQDMKLAEESDGIDQKAAAAGIHQDELDRRSYRKTSTI